MSTLLNMKKKRPSEIPPLQCAIIDDDSISLTITEGYVKKTSELNLVATFNDPVSGLKNLQNNPDIELLFLDIEMPGLSGLELLDALDDPPMTLLTTASQEYAVQAYTFDVLGYLVKPFEYAKFYAYVKKAFSKKAEQVDAVPKPRQNVLYVKVDNRLQRIVVDDLLFIESAQNYVILHLSNGDKLITMVTMKKMLEKLPPYFIRIHRSYILNIEKIEYIEDNYVHLNGNTLSISTRYRPFLLKSLEIV